MTARLIREPSVQNPDDFHQALIDSEGDRDEDASEMVNAKLVLLRANPIGDLGVLREALAPARAGVAGES